MREKTITLDRLVRWVGLGLLITAILLLLNYLSHVLLPFFIAWFFAYLLYPMVKYVERHLHLPRALSILVTLIIVICVISGVKERRSKTIRTMGVLRITSPAVAGMASISTSRRAEARELRISLVSPLATWTERFSLPSNIVRRMPSRSRDGLYSFLTR